jgi:hypothetical protein
LLRGEAKAIDTTVTDIVAALRPWRAHPPLRPRIERRERHLPLFGARRMGLRRLCKLARLDSLQTRV